MTGAVPQQYLRRPTTAHPPQAIMPRVLVIGHAPLTAEGVARVVEHAPGVAITGVTCSVATATTVIALRRPSVIVIDEQLDPSLHAVSKFAAAHGAPGIVVLLGPGGPQSVRAAQARRAGATSVVSSTVSPSVLIEAIRHTAAGKPFLSPGLHSGQAVRLQGLGGPGGSLSPRESEVLHLIAEGMDNKRIADMLGVSIETIRTHAKNTARKLGARDRSQVVAMAYRSGFVDRYSR